jgi:hypothetical protein
VTYGTRLILGRETGPGPAALVHNHQRLVHTFVTNLRGPEDPLLFGGATVRAIIAIPAITGNVTVAFAAASYAGTLRIAILSDPARMPDVPALAATLRHELSPCRS